MFCSQKVLVGRNSVGKCSKDFFIYKFLVGRHVAGIKLPHEIFSMLHQNGISFDERYIHTYAQGNTILLKYKILLARQNYKTMNLLFDYTEARFKTRWSHQGSNARVWPRLLIFFQVFSLQKNTSTKQGNKEALTVIRCRLKSYCKNYMSGETNIFFDQDSS